MPKMTGYDVNQLICQKWKNCRTIFITGNESIESARKVIRDSKNVVDYVLKLEDNETLMQAVRKAIYELDHIMQERELRENVRKYMAQSMPILRRDFFKEFLTETSFSREDLKESFSKLDFPFRADVPVIPLLGAFRAKDGSLQHHVDTTFLIVDQILSEYLSPKFIQYGFPMNDVIPLGIWFIQLLPNGSVSPDEAVRYIHSYLDLIQEHSERFSQMTVSFILSHDIMDWQKVPQTYKPNVESSPDLRSLGKPDFLYRRSRRDRGGQKTGRRKTNQDFIPDIAADSGIGRQRAFLFYLETASGWV